MPDASVDAVVTDPPYGLSFMGKKWDYDVPSTDVWAECLRVLKPGGHLLAFAGTRTQHRMCVRIEDAGFEIRDMIAWVYGSGFPKSHNLDGERKGWGTALKPAMEPITVARKPLTGTVAENVQEWGTGAINVDGCRVGTDAGWSYPSGRGGSGWHGRESLARNLTTPMRATLGRWPSNLIHDGSDEVVAGFPVTGISSGGRIGNAGGGAVSNVPTGAHRKGNPGFGDSGSASRFFKCCEPDATCPLCCLPYAEACNTVQAWKNRLASTAEKRGWTSQATSEFIARVSAIGPASERIAPAVKSAGNLCDSCAISIAVALVATKTSAFSSEELLVTLASTGNSNASILIPSLASFADLWGSIDTIPTTNSLSLLFGSVRDAIANSTKKDTEARAEPRCEPSRFAYVPKASKADREDGLEGFNVGTKRILNGGIPSAVNSDPVGMSGGGDRKARNYHPTVKPTALMQYLCRLVTPPGGTVLDPFTGSGSTGKAAILEGFNFIGIEREAEYVEIAKARISDAERRHSENLVSA
jgi:site-specific DNA-methyltransferase (adenine-specific)